MLLEDTRDAPLAATSFSMNMIFFTQGKQFTAGELEKLLVEAGFEEIALTPSYGYYSLVTGRKRRTSRHPEGDRHTHSASGSRGSYKPRPSRVALSYVFRVSWLAKGEGCVPGEVAIDVGLP